jgi:hypothetical protein
MNIFIKSVRCPKLSANVQKFEIDIRSNIFLYKLQITNYKLQITNYKLQITNYKLQITLDNIAE